MMATAKLLQMIRPVLPQENLSCAVTGDLTNTNSVSLILHFCVKRPSEIARGQIQNSNRL